MAPTPTRRSGRASLGVLTEKSTNISSPKAGTKKKVKGIEALDSPDKTSDYGSESSRSVTPAETPVEGPSREESPVMSIPAEVNQPSDTKEEEKDTLIRRKVESTEETQDEDEDTNAVLESGLISAEAIKEEQEAMENNILEAKAEAEPEEKTLSQEERYEMLMVLLKKSEFFTNYLKNKMDEQIKATEIKKAKALEKEKKRLEKEGKGGEAAVASPKARKGKQINPASKSKASPVTKSVKRAAEDEEPSGRAAKKTKVESEERKFNGQVISERQPKLLTGGVMRNYQLDGYEWLVRLYENGINGILADEMGLGKTIQCIALFCHLYEMGIIGPFLVVAPLSTVPNWVNEFKRFAPDVPCVLYHGSKEERAALRSEIGETSSCELVPKMHKVVVTSYEIAMNDRALLSDVWWKFLVVDEGHRLKNMECKLIKQLKMYKTDHRLLLTGTPLQNNLRELFSLLNFILPYIFDDVKVFESWFDAKEIEENEENTNAKILQQEQKNSVVNMLHQIILPFLRRRVKTDVGLEIPPKKEVLVYCPLTEKQKEMYQAVVEKTIADLLTKKVEEVPLEEQGKGKRPKEKIDYSVFDQDESKIDDRFEDSLWKLVKKDNSRISSAYKMENLARNEINFSIKSRMMDMRKAVNHPYLIDYPVTDDGYYKIDEDLISICGKLKVLDQMLEELVKRGHKILLFSQMTRLLDILGDYLNWRNLKFSRLDGSMSFVDRQANIDTFNTDPNVPVFLLSTRAGGLGINLTAADTCIIYDSDWNPQQDLQAQDRCHRIGQTKPVMVYRMVTKGTIDEKIVLRAAAKRKIEKLVIHKDKFNSVTSDVKEKAAIKIDAKELLQLLHSKDHVGAITCQEGDVLSKSDLNKLLDRSDLTWSRQASNSNRNQSVQQLDGVFKVLDDETKNEGGLRSVVDN